MSTTKKNVPNVINFSDLEKSWASPYVARKCVSEFSGGILHPRTMSNFDSKGTGPKGRIRLGRVIAYPVHELVNWMEARAKAV